MLSIFDSIRCVRKIAISASIVLGAGLSASPGQAQQLLGTSGGDQVVCTGSSGFLVVRDNSCDVGGTGLQFPSGFAVGNATFNDPSPGTDSTVFSGGTVSFNSVTTAFGGGSVSINAPLTVTGSSATFSTPTTFNNAITSNGISNTGNISTSGALSGGSASITGALSAGSVAVGTGGVTVAAGANVSMGGNQVHNVATGTAGTDAVNVTQLNAATSGITTNVTALQTLTATHTTQISALQAADTVFTNSIDALELTVEGLDQRIGKVDDRASAGTAAAIALSGAMFLPGKSFNLTGNIASYRGARAAAIQFGALVSDNVALNAGISHGFNKGGKTGLRAGFTIGW